MEDHLVQRNELGEIMHGLTDERVVPPEKVWINMPTFPQVSASKRLSMLLVSRVKAWRTEGSRAVLTVEGRYVAERYTYRYFDYRQVFSEQGNTTALTVLLDFVRDRTVRLTLCEGFTPYEPDSFMIAPMERQTQPELTVAEDDAVLTLSNGLITAKIDQNVWNLTLSDDQGVFYQQFGRDNHSYMPYEITPFGFLYDGETGRRFASEAVCADAYESFYGLGEVFSDLDHRGRKYRLWNTNALGVNTERMYKSIPLFYSSRGYGMFIHASGAVQADFGADLSKAVHLLAEEEGLDCFIMRGSRPQQLLQEYFALTGKPAVPPKWSLGLWISKISYRSREEVERVARLMRANDLPCDVIHVDTDWFAENWICDWQFEPTRFPDVSGMIDGLHQNGYKLSLWQLPYVERGSISHAVYDEALQKGYFASMPDGDIRFPHGLIDFSNPEAVRWYQQKLLKPLLEMGVDVIKADFGESAPPFFKYAGVDGEKMHNLYALLYNQAAYEVTSEVKGAQNALIWARSAYAGSQRYPVHWGGDAGTDFGSLATSVKGCLNASLSGIPFWSSDLGGFWFDTDPQLYIRWVQFGMFCSHARLHGFYSREPWDYGEETVALFRQIVKLRYRLLPYLYNQVLAVQHEQTLIHRPLCYEYPDDLCVRGIDTEYLFGSELLVAPVLTRDNAVHVYFPEGRWTDFFTGEVHSGKQWETFTCPLDRFPVYLRENAIIPMGPDQQYVDEKPLEELTVILAPGERPGENRLTLYDASATLSLRVQGVMLTFGSDAATCPCTLVWRNVQLKHATMDGNELPLQHVGPDTHIRIPATGGAWQVNATR
ncbi:MAG: glycoside hydrolase family 31 protein [Eubacteriales bacterium]|nr:glycoside hydrolase family 31 protein [Eubacteriales bacterium]